MSIQVIFQQQDYITDQKQYLETDCKLLIQHIQI